MDRKLGTWTFTGNVIPGHWTGSHGQETWYLDTVDRFPFTGDMIPGQIPMDRKLCTWTTDSRHGVQTVPMEKRRGTYMATGQVPTDIRHGHVDKFPWKRSMVPGKVPMETRNDTWTSSHGQEAWYSTYLDKFPWTGGVAQNLP